LYTIDVQLALNKQLWDFLVGQQDMLCVEDAEGEWVADVAGQEEPELVAAADHLFVMKN